MPRGVYPRRPAQLAAARENFAKGHTPEARAKATARLREIAADPAWREKVSEATKTAMHRPEVRARHLAGLARQEGTNFRGGNGKPLTPTVTRMAEVLEPLGFVREFAIKTKGHGTAHRTPPVYKADFGHPDLLVAIELDGPSHRPRERQRLDQKKTEVLKALGWRVIRVAHAEA